MCNPKCVDLLKCIAHHRHCHMASGAGVPLEVLWEVPLRMVVWGYPGYHPVVGIDWIRMENTATGWYSSICLRSKHLGFHERFSLTPMTSNHGLENNQELLVLSMGLRQ